MGRGGGKKGKEAYHCLIFIHNVITARRVKILPLRKRGCRPKEENLEEGKGGKLTYVDFLKLLLITGCEGKRTL